MNVLFSISDDYGYVSRLIAMKKNIFQSNLILANSYKCGKVRGFGNLREEKRSKVAPQPLRLMTSAKQGDSVNQFLL